MIAVLGAGVSGLSLAHQLKKQGREFVIIDANSNAGGVIQSSLIDGFLCELGPNTILINNLEIKSLIEDLGLWDSIIHPNSTAIRRRYILKETKIEPIPTSIKMAITSKLVNWTTLYNLIKEPFIPGRNAVDEESLASLCERRFGQQILDDFITPFITGIYAGDPKKMSSRHTFSNMKKAEDQYGSILKGMFQLMKEKKRSDKDTGLSRQKIFSFKNGLNQLIKKLEYQLKNNLLLESKVFEIKKEGKKFLISYKRGDETHSIKTDSIVSCLPANQLASIIRPIDNQCAEKLLNINYVPVISIHLVLDRKKVDFSRPAFGILSREKEEVPFLGILFNSRFFPHSSPESDKELITIIAGGSRYPDLIDKPSEEISNEIITSIKKILGYNGKPEIISIKKWKKGIPQYELGHDSIISATEKFSNKFPGFYISGNFLKGVSVSDCIKNSLTLAKKHF